MLAFVKEVTKSLRFSEKFEKIRTGNEIDKIKMTTIFRENV
jgi:hypothetical protein